MTREREITNDKRAEEIPNIDCEERRQTKIEIQVDHFPMVKAKFTKEAWNSGEGGGEGGEGEGG